MAWYKNTIVIDDSVVDALKLWSSQKINAVIIQTKSELNTNLSNHISNATSHNASQISVNPTGNITSSTVQNALTELDSKKETPSGSQAKADAVQANLTSHINRTDNPHTVSAHQVNAYSQTETDNNILSAKKEANLYTDGAISTLVNGSPEALNTLYELANALGNDPNFSTTVLTNIGNVNTDLQNHKKHMNPIVASIIFGGA